MSYQDKNDLAVAVLAACGMEFDDVESFTLTCRADRPSRLTVTRAWFDPDPEALAAMRRTVTVWVPAPKEPA